MNLSRSGLLCATVAVLGATSVPAADASAVHSARHGHEGARRAAKHPRRHLVATRHTTRHRRTTTTAARPVSAQPTSTQSPTATSTTPAKAPTAGGTPVPVPVPATTTAATTKTATTVPTATAPTTAPTAPTVTSAPSVTSALTSTVPFAATGPWRATLPDSAPLDPDSSAIVSNLTGQISSYYGHAVLNTYSWSAPIYTVPANQPTVNMTWNNCQGKTWEDPRFAAALQNVPIPAGAVASEGSDAAMVIYQPSTNTEWEFWKAAQTNGTWSACWGGEIQNVSQNPGIFASGMGATATGLPMLGYLVRVQDLRSGSINHAINLEVPTTRAGVYSWPATRTDGASSSASAPVQGERFRFPASLNLSQFKLTPGQLMIARAIQQYGAIVTDTSGSVSIQAEDPRPYEVNGAPDPYTAFFGGPQYSWLQGIPWQDLQAVALNYGQPAS